MIYYGNESLKAGFSEIRVFGKKGKVYAAPNLIFHYIMEHDYTPPKEFIEAVCYGASPNSVEYYKQVIKLKVN